MIKESKATGIKAWPEEESAEREVAKKGTKVACAKFALTSKGSEKGRG